MAEQTESKTRLEKATKAIEKMSDIKVVSFLVAIVGSLIVIGILTDESQATINAT